MSEFDYEKAFKAIVREIYPTSSDIQMQYLQLKFKS